MKNLCFHMNRKLWVTMAMLLCLALPGLAQKVTIHGNVSDELGEALIGATVMEKGTTNGTSTDLDGNYQLSVSPGGVLVVSYVGYDPVEEAINGRNTINVVLKENATMLAETVVIGYGTIKKSDATGSVALVKPDEVEAGISTSAQDLLVGASPGVVVTSNGGAPQGGAQIRIRGGASLSASNDPLIVLDGVPLVTSDDISGMGNPLSMIAPENIESMTILKDASATAIYGSRASNGVIIITTKKGKSGRPQVNFSASATVQTPRKTWETLNAAEYSSMIRNYWGANSEAAEALGNADTNWQKEILRTTVSQDYSLSVGGTAGFLPYRVSGTYTMNNGILKDTQMQRVTAGFNLTPKFFGGLLQINAAAKGYYIRNNFGDDGAIGSALVFNPTVPVRDNLATGNSAFPYFFNGYTTVQSPLHDFNTNSALNPVGMLEEYSNISDVYRSNGNLQIDYAFHFLPDLHVNLNLGYDVTKSTTNKYINQNSARAYKDGPRKDGAGYYDSYYALYRNTLLEAYLNYKKHVDAIYSDFDVTAGYSWQRFDDHNRGNGTVFMTEGFLPAGTQNGQLVLDPASKDRIGTANSIVYPGFSGNLMLISFYGRLNYAFRDTYLLTFTLRDDGTSRYSKENRWGLFPAVALAWKLNNMPFMESVRENMNEFKLRLGWGVTGQQSFGGYFPYIATYIQSQQGSFYPNMWTGQYLGANGNVVSNTYYPDGYNANLKWEETTTWNVGLDMGWWNNRFNVALDWYLRKTKDLITLATATPGAFTTNELYQNIGDLKNLGLEATITAKPVVTEDFTWTTAYNVAWNKNKITKISSDATQITAGDNINVGTGGKVMVHQVGYPAYSFNLYEQIYDTDGKPIEGAFVDQNGDGQISSADLVTKHSKDPSVTMSWNNNFSYKNWDFGFQLRASIGNYVYNCGLAGGTTMNTTFRNGLTNLLKSDVYFQGNTLDNQLSDYWLENAGFVRCDNITLGYTWPDLINNNLRLRLYGAVQNPFVITRYRGIDPEVVSGIDNNVYPRPVSFTVGIVATF